MTVDFHTHTFPDKIAESAIAHLCKLGGVKPYREGTLSSLKESMKRSGIDYSVILPVATEPRQTASINRLAAELNGKDGIIYAGAVHPDCENIDQTLDFIKNAGLFGIKLHPDYQGAYFDDERNIKIMEKAAARGLFIVTHAGMDVAYRNDIHCTPDMVLNVLNKLGKLVENKLILAHLGGFTLGEEVIEKLCGKPVYMDTAVVFDYYPDELSRRIIRAHGADRILFATDSPWADQKNFAEHIRRMDFTDEELEKMLHKNAEKILSVSGNKLT